MFAMCAVPGGFLAPPAARASGGCANVFPTRGCALVWIRQGRGGTNCTPILGTARTSAWGHGVWARSPERSQSRCDNETLSASDASPREGRCNDSVGSRMPVKDALNASSLFSISVTGQCRVTKARAPGVPTLLRRREMDGNGSISLSPASLTVRVVRPVPLENELRSRRYQRFGCCHAGR